jgi:hypothetical protein
LNKTLFSLVRGYFKVLLLLQFTPDSGCVSRSGHGAAVTGNGDGPLVGREPSAEDRTTPMKEKVMSKGESTGNDAVPEPHGGSSMARWAARARRARNEAGLYLLRGAATAVGGAIVAYGGVWLQTR